jgi:YfiH family protein
VKTQKVDRSDIHHVENYAKFDDVGFHSGIILKGPWKSHDDIFKLLKSEIIDSNLSIVSPVQLHGSDIALIDNLPNTSNIAADGVLTRNDKLCLTVKTADCLPLTLADPLTGLFGAIHIGWRGLAGGIIENLTLAIKNLDMDFDRLYISLGPCIGDCCFEIGGEVAILFDNEFVKARDDRYFLDIRTPVKKKLVASGIPEDNIVEITECTSCQSEKYYSYRRDRQAPIQMVSFISRKSKREV